MTGGTASGILVFLFASLAVIALALLATRMLSRWNTIQNRGRRLRVLEGVAIGRNRHLLLVAVGKEVMVIGSSEGGVSLLHTVSDPEELLGPDWEEQTPEIPAAPSSSLAGVESSIRSHLDKMRNLLQRPGGGSDAQ